MVEAKFWCGFLKNTKSRRLERASKMAWTRRGNLSAEQVESQLDKSVPEVSWRQGGKTYRRESDQLRWGLRGRQWRAIGLFVRVVTREESWISTSHFFPSCPLSSFPAFSLFWISFLFFFLLLSFLPHSSLTSQTLRIQRMFGDSTPSLASQVCFL